jgi:hypothetical protein
MSMGTAAKSRILLVNMNSAGWTQNIAGRKDTEIAKDSLPPKR